MFQHYEHVSSSDEKVRKFIFSRKKRTEREHGKTFETMKEKPNRRPIKKRMSIKRWAINLTQSAIKLSQIIIISLLERENRDPAIWHKYYKRSMRAVGFFIHAGWHKWSGICFGFNISLSFYVVEHRVCGATSKGDSKAYPALLIAVTSSNMCTHNSKQMCSARETHWN